MEEKSEIATIPNKYKNILNDLIDLINCLDTEFSDWPDFSNWPDSSNWLRLIDKGLRNAPRFIGNLSTLLEEDRLDENVLVTSLKLAPKI